MSPPSTRPPASARPQPRQHGKARAAILATLVLLLAWIQWTRRFGAPWAPSRNDAIERGLELAEVGPGDLVVDLGAGDGRVLIAAANRGARGRGIEVDPVRCLWARRRVAAAGQSDHVEIDRGDFFDAPLADADVVFCYLMQHTNDELAEKLRAELTPGTRIVSNTYRFAGMDCVARDRRRGILVYVI